MPTVMIVDDIEMMRNTIARLLIKEGIEPLTAASGPEAISILEQRVPDVILLDVSMPGMDGLAVLEHIQSNPQWSTIPVIMLTAVSDTHTIHRAAQLGAKEYLVKATFSIAEMMDHLRRYIPRDSVRADVL